MKKIFGGINLTWKKLIIFSIITAIYTAIMALLPITENTSFRDIAIKLEWWILFGIIIITNSKSPKDSALKCFVFFLISQPLIYLIQVPFTHLGFGIFQFYKFWFILTLCTLPMGFIGYYINKKNILSIIILLPILIILARNGLEYFTAMVENFPYHLLSFISCFLIIIIVVLNLFDKAKPKVITLSIVALFTISYIIFKGGIMDSEYETYKLLDDYGITFVGKIKVSNFTETNKGNVEIVTSTDDIHSVKIYGKKNSKYKFTIKDEANNEYSFEYYFDKDTKSVVVELKK